MKVPEIYSNFRLREIIEEYIHSDRDREILIQKYCNKKTITQLAEMMDVSETTVKNVLYKNSFKIFSILEEKNKAAET